MVMIVMFVRYGQTNGKLEARIFTGNFIDTVRMCMSYVRSTSKVWCWGEEGVSLRLVLHRDSRDSTEWRSFKLNVTSSALDHSLCNQGWENGFSVFFYTNTKWRNSIRMSSAFKLMSLHTLCTLEHISYLLIHGAEPFLRSRQLCSHSRSSQHFMEPEGSIPCSQEPSTGPYPEPYQSNPLHPILVL
jgi:hypothetical protein